MLNKPLISPSFWGAGTLGRGRLTSQYISRSLAVPVAQQLEIVLFHHCPNCLVHQNLFEIGAKNLAFHMSSKHDT